MIPAINCNICGEEKNCYALPEFDPRGPIMRPGRRMFLICTDCLKKLIEPIRTEKTVIPDLPNKKAVGVSKK